MYLNFPGFITRMCPCFQWHHCYWQCVLSNPFILFQICGLDPVQRLKRSMWCQFPMLGIQSIRFSIYQPLSWASSIQEMKQWKGNNAISLKNIFDNNSASELFCLYCIILLSPGLPTLPWSKNAFGQSNLLMSFCGVFTEVSKTRDIDLVRIWWCNER